MRQARPAVEYGPVERASPSRGLLRLDAALDRIKLERREPPGALAHWILHLWRVSWDLGEEVYVQESVPHPSVNLSFEDDEATHGSLGQACVTGVWPKNYLRRLTGRGSATGIAFRAAQFRPWFRASVAGLTGKTLPLESRLPVAPGLARRVLDADLEGAASLCEACLLPLRPGPDSWADRLADAVELMRRDRQLNRTDELARRLGVGVRTLQRLFLSYVGVGAKWVAMHFRVHEAIDRLRAEPELAVGDLALELGYYDQAHFVHEFRRMTGAAPEAYRR